MNDKLLPLGTIVRLKNQTIELMIIGYYPVDTEKKLLYDYIACIYPFGINGEKHYFINKKEIESIHFYGQQSEELVDIRKKIETIRNMKLQKKTEKEILDYLNSEAKV